MEAETNNPCDFIQQPDSISLWDALDHGKKQILTNIRGDDMLKHLSEKFFHFNMFFNITAKFTFQSMKNMYILMRITSFHITCYLNTNIIIALCLSMYLFIQQIYIIG